MVLTISYQIYNDTISQVLHRCGRTAHVYCSTWELVTIPAADICKFDSKQIHSHVVNNYIVHTKICSFITACSFVINCPFLQHENNILQRYPMFLTNNFPIFSHIFFCVVKFTAKRMCRERRRLSQTAATSMNRSGPIYLTDDADSAQTRSKWQAN